MLKTFSLLVMCFIMTLTLQAAGFSNPQDGSQARASNMASTYVPIESWVYPAFERLAAEGYLPTAFFSLRPWTRMDCALLVDEAEAQLAAKPTTCVPRLPRLTFRAEGLLAPHRDLAFPGFFYFNVHHMSSYTNNRQLIGSWIGHEADGEQAWATSHLSPHSFVELSGCSMRVNREFLRGGSLRDLRATVDMALRPEWQLRVEEQTECWHFPLLSASPQHNAAFTLQLSYRPIGRVGQ